MNFITVVVNYNASLMSNVYLDDILCDVRVSRLYKEVSVDDIGYDFFCVLKLLILISYVLVFTIMSSIFF